MAAERMRVGILGAGGIADFHAKAVQAIPNALLAAVCDQQASRAAAFQRKWDVPAMFESLRAMLETGKVDVVHVLVPPAAHARAAIACLEAGCDVFLEKPAAISTAECEAIGAAAERAQRQVGVNHNLTYHPGVIRLIQAVQDRRLGRLEHVSVCYNLPLKNVPASHWIFQEPRNIVLEMAPHPISIIQTLMGAVESVASLVSGEKMLASGVPFYQSWQASMLCERGTAQLLFAVGRDYLESRVHVVGQDGVAMLDLRRNALAFHEKTPLLAPNDDLRQCAAVSWSLLRDGLRNFRNYLAGMLRLKPPYDLFTDSVVASIAAFYAALRDGRRPPVGLAEGAATVHACEQMVSGASLLMKESA